MKKKLIYNNKKYLLTKFYLLKYQAYKQKKFYFFNINLEQLNIKIKQALKIIYLYHINNKKILFIGFPYSKKKIKNKNHLFVPKNFLTKRFIKTQKSILLKKNFQKFTNNFYKNFNLIVFYNPVLKDQNLINELNKNNIPLILFGNLFTNSQISYNILGSFIKTKIKSFCFFLIFSILKKNY